MQRYEYKIVPAPAKSERIKGVKRTADRFAHTLTTLVNDHALEGWEYIRSDTLPCEERVGFTGRKTSFLNMLVFRRGIAPETRTATSDTAVVTTPPATPPASDPQVEIRPARAEPRPLRPMFGKPSTGAWSSEEGTTAKPRLVADARNAGDTKGRGGPTSPEYVSPFPKA